LFDGISASPSQTTCIVVAKKGSCIFWENLIFLFIKIEFDLLPWPGQQYFFACDMDAGVEWTLY